MIPLWTSDAIAAATQGTAHGRFDVTGVAFDSRDLESGDLFVALAGEQADGHQFVNSAVASGASGVLVSHTVDHPHVLVSDTRAALDALARAARARTTAKIVGVTGSVGKTGTKEALADALQRANRGTVHRSVKSYNNHTGVPLSLARMPESSAYAVFEMGMNHAGELAALTPLVRPHVAIVTTVASVHREFFDSEEQIADAKGEIFEGLEPGGTAIIPYDNIHCDRLIAAAKPYAEHIVTFGRNTDADVHVLDAVELAGGALVTARLQGVELCFTLSQPGDHWIVNALAVLAAVQAVGGDLAAAGLALADLPGIAGRGARHRVRAGSGTALLIDESYNANPASMLATLAVLGKTEAKRRVAVLGEMKELGAEGEAFHAALADPVLRAKVDLAILVGDGMAPLAAALGARCKVVQVADHRAALDAVRAVLDDGDVVLVKGSNSVGLSKLVAVLAGNEG